MHDQFPISIDLAIHPEEMGMMSMPAPDWMPCILPGPMATT